MSSSSFSGGIEVKASTLFSGDTIRDPRKKNRILIVEDAGNVIFCRGYEQSDTKEHRFLDGNQIVIKVTNAQTDTTKEGKA